MQKQSSIDQMELTGTMSPAPPDTIAGSVDGVASPGSEPHNIQSSKLKLYPGSTEGSDTGYGWLPDAYGSIIVGLSTSPYVGVICRYSDKTIADGGVLVRCGMRSDVAGVWLSNEFMSVNASSSKAPNSGGFW